MAWEQARCGGHRLPPGLRLIELPCAGHLGQVRLLTALGNRADGVLVLTCHDGNCHSEEGNRQARRQTAGLQDLLPQIGLAKERLALDSLAANMGAAFAAVTRAFETRLQTLGPNPLADAGIGRAGGRPETSPPDEPLTVKGQP
jgi:coenzyme F420-reducing hydrogenase delta subunit